MKVLINACNPAFIIDMSEKTNKDALTKLRRVLKDVDNIADMDMYEIKDGMHIFYWSYDYKKVLKDKEYNKKNNKIIKLLKANFTYKTTTHEELSKHLNRNNDTERAKRKAIRGF